jgi:hypothetical protein
MLRLAVNNVPIADSLEIFNAEERALLWFWLQGVDVDVGYEALAWSRIACANGNGRAS